MVLYLGYAALILIAIYFTYGILKISGEGLSILGYENNFIREGFSDKQKESSEKQIKQLLSMVKSRTYDLYSSINSSYSGISLIAFTLLNNLLNRI